MSKPIQSKSSPCTCGHPAYRHHDELWDCVDCDCRKYVFAKEGVATINGIPLNTPEGHAEEQKYMTGQEWYDRFKRELVADSSVSYKGDMLAVARRASGIDMPITDPDTKVKAGGGAKS